MNARAIHPVLILALALLALLATGCELTAPDDLEMARALMRSLSDRSPAAGYTSAEAKVGVPSTGIHITLLEVDPTAPPSDGDWTFTLSAEFSDFVPPGYERSAVTGTVDAVLVVSFVKDTATALSLQVDGELEVSGENAGTYLFDASLHYDPGTRAYSYSGTVSIDGEVYTFKG